jgi:regulator of RNase E activity RraB
MRVLAVLGGVRTTFMLRPQGKAIVAYGTWNGEKVEPTFPNDADGDALRRVAADGNDLTKPMTIDFTVVVPDEASATSVARAARSAGYETAIDLDEESDESICVCTKLMLATYDNVLRAQEELQELAAPYGGEVDGWGTFGNND